MRKISEETLKVLKHHTFYEKSALSGDSPVQWHHVFTFAGKQIDAPWNIVPLTPKEHQMVTPHHHSYIKEIDEMVQRIALNRATREELLEYFEAGFVELRDKLNDIYEDF